jgi:hypothetical protein
MAWKPSLNIWLWRLLAWPLPLGHLLVLPVMLLAQDPQRAWGEFTLTVTLWWNGLP